MAVAAVMMFSAGAAMAASISKSTVTASVAFTDLVGQVSMSLEFMNLNSSIGDGTTTQMWWDTSAITLGVTQWRRADSYIVLHTTITSANGAVQVYTDNTHASAAPKYTGVGISTNAAGLVGLDPLGLDLTASSKTLSMCWRVTDAVATSTTIAQGAPGKPDRLYSTELGNAYPCFEWMKDAATMGFANGEDYVTVKDANRGIQHAESTWAYASSPDYLYFGALFTGAVTPRIYRTSRLMIEAFTE